MALGVTLSRPPRCPSWKIQTMAPNAALTESRFISTAFSGSTTERSSRKSTTIVVSIAKPTAHGVCCRM